VIPLHLKLSGFLSYREAVELDFTAFDLACISGPNGAGKSSLLDAITWALFGQARKRDESLVNLQAKAAEVAFTFGYEENVYRVVRSLPRGKTTMLEFQIRQDSRQKAESSKQEAESSKQLAADRLLLSADWRPLTERTLRETQVRIEQVLRLDYDTFVNAAFFLQGKADQFAQQSPGKRKEILGNILGLEVWETYRERAAERRKTVERELDSVDVRLQEIAAELAEETPRKQKLAELEERLKQVSAVRKTQEAALENLRKAAASQVAAEKARLEEERRGLKEQEKVISGQSSVISELTVQIEGAKKTLEEAEEKVTQRGDLEAGRAAAREQFAQLKAENDLLKAQMEELRARIDRLEAAEGAACPLCGQALSEEHRQSTLEQLNEEGKEKGDRFRVNRSSLDELGRQVADGEWQIAKLSDVERRRLALSNSVSQLTERIGTLQDSVKNWEAAGAKRLDEVEATLSGEKYARAAPEPAADLDAAERTLFDLQEQENRLNQEVGAARQKVAVLDDLRARRARLESEREALGLQIGRYKSLERAFGKDGVPALLIEQALPQIEAKANELLDRLSGGAMSVRFVTQAEYKDKKREDLKETLDIQISDGAGRRDYEMYSGGEAFRANFAIRLALSEVLAQRKGARLQTLVIDEGFGSQDAQGRQRLIEAINAVRGDFARILVITHLDELKDAFPTRIEVEKTERGSAIQRFSDSASQRVSDAESLTR
jgi:exonuclease SbcC